MTIELSRVELLRLAGIGDGMMIWAERAKARYLGPGIALVPAAVIGLVGAWLLMSGYFSDRAESEPVKSAIVSEMPRIDGLTSDAMPSANKAPFDQAATSAQGEAVEERRTVATEGLSIGSQSWRRGGLGSNALVSFTLRNKNDFAVRDIEISCAFSRRDGSHLTDRKRVIADTVAMRSRKTFTRLHVGFVNVNADQAKCDLLGASKA